MYILVITLIGTLGTFISIYNIIRLCQEIKELNGRIYHKYEAQSKADSEKIKDLQDQLEMAKQTAVNRLSYFASILMYEVSCLITDIEDNLMKGKGEEKDESEIERFNQVLWERIAMDFPMLEYTNIHDIYKLFQSFHSEEGWWYKNREKLFDIQRYCFVVTRTFFETLNPR